VKRKVLYSTRGNIKRESVTGPKGVFVPPPGEGGRGFKKGEGDLRPQVEKRGLIIIRANCVTRGFAVSEGRHFFLKNIQTLDCA